MNALFCLFLIATLAWIQGLIGGTRLLFAIPPYLLLATAGVLGIAALRRRTPLPSGGVILTTLLFAGYILLRAVNSEVTYLWWPDFFMTLAALMVYLITALQMVSAQTRLWFVAAVLVLALGQTALAWYQNLTGTPYHFFGFENRRISALGVRGTGMFISGNHLAGFLESAAMLALGVAVWARLPNAVRLLAGAVALACYSGVAVSGSRGGYLSSAFSLLVFAFLSIRAWLAATGQRIGARTLKPLLFGLAGLALLLGVVGWLGSRNELVVRRFQAIGMEDIRWANWAAAVDQFHLAPWLGTGAGTHLIYGRLFRRAQLQADPVHAHGDYLELLAEYGLVGGFFALLFLGAHLIPSFREQGYIAGVRMRSGPGVLRSNTLALSIGAWGGIAALLAHSVVDFNMHIPANALFYAFLFGVLANAGATRAQTPLWVSTLTAARLLIPVLGVAMLLKALPKLEGEKWAEKARIALRDGDYQSAIRLSRSAITSEPINPYPWFYLGEANQAIGVQLPVPHLRDLHLTQAIDAYQNGLKRLPHDHSLLIRLGQAYDRMGRYEEAEAAYKEALEWDPNLGAVHAYYAVHLQRRGRTKEAEESRKTAASLSAGSHLQQLEGELRQQQREEKAGEDPTLAPPSFLD